MATQKNGAKSAVKAKAAKAVKPTASSPASSARSKPAGKSSSAKSSATGTKNAVGKTPSGKIVKSATSIKGAASKSSGTTKQKVDKIVKPPQKAPQGGAKVASAKGSSVKGSAGSAKNSAVAAGSSKGKAALKSSGTKATSSKAAVQPASKPKTKEKQVVNPTVTIKSVAKSTGKSAAPVSVGKTKTNTAVKQDHKPIKKEDVAKKKVEEKNEAPKETAKKSSAAKKTDSSKGTESAKPTKKAPAKPVEVVIPKTSTTAAVKYEPSFTKSVLDQPVSEPVGPTMRYSDSELNEFRELINKKLDAARKELAYLQGLITRKDEMGGDNDDARYMTMEDGSMSMEREQLSQMASRQIQFIDHLEKALMRIESKTYGVCRVTGKLIDKARLRAVPHATLSMEAKMGLVK